MDPDSAAELYGLPLEDFTAARNELADRLKDQGQGSEAKRVRALKKPSVAAWTVNQVARHDAAALEEFFRLRGEIEGAASPGELRSRTEERRKILTKLVGRARTLLTDAGHAAAPGTLDKFVQTLMAADDESRDEVLAGMVDRELTTTTSNFGAFGSLDAAIVTFDEPDEPDPRVERLKMEAAAAEREADEFEKVAAEAETAATKARDRAADARRKAIKTRERATAAEGS